MSAAGDTKLLAEILAELKRMNFTLEHPKRTANVEQAEYDRQFYEAQTRLREAAAEAEAREAQSRRIPLRKL